MTPSCLPIFDSREGERDLNVGHAGQRPLVQSGLGSGDSRVVRKLRNEEQRAAVSLAMPQRTQRR